MSTPTTSSPRWRRAAAAAAIALVLAGVFMLYTRPEFMLRMADHVWACF
ncbi:MAG: hypothetical protein ACN6O3_04005 [Comamonas sp.]